MNRISWYGIGLLSLLFIVAPQLRAQESAPGDVGTPECVYVQNTVHDDLRMEDDQWRNKGQLMKRVQAIVSPELGAGHITEECSSCITNQYARGIEMNFHIPCGPPENIDERFARIADRVPGFGGMFRDDAQDVVFVYLVDPSQHDAAIQALQASFGSERVPTARVEVLQGDYDFRQLKEWKTSLRLLLSSTVVVSTGIDESQNRLSVELVDIPGGIIDLKLDELGIPEDAVVLEQAEPPEPQATLEDVVRPLVGSLAMVWWDRNGNVPSGLGGRNACTLGVVARRGWELGIITASHCSDRQAEVEGTQYDQPNFDEPRRSVNHIATETVDPAWIPAGRWPCSYPHVPGYEIYSCRASDALFARLTSGRCIWLPIIYGSGSGRLWCDPAPGFIARTDNTRSGPYDAYNIRGSYRIVDQFQVPVMGDRVDKVGFRSGHSHGMITRTCSDFLGRDVRTGAVQDSYLWCMFKAGLSGSEGDSGSPVFKVLNAPRTNDVALVGILSGSGWFSPILGVDWELMGRIYAPNLWPRVCAYPYNC